MANDVGYILQTIDGDRFVTLYRSDNKSVVPNDGHTSINDDFITATMNANNGNYREERFTFTQQESGIRQTVAFWQEKVQADTAKYIINANLNSKKEFDGSNTCLEGASVQFNINGNWEAVGTISSGKCVVYLEDGDQSYNVKLVPKQLNCNLTINNTIGIERGKVQVASGSTEIEVSGISSEYTVPSITPSTGIVDRGDVNGCNFSATASETYSDVSLDGLPNWVETENGTQSGKNFIYKLKFKTNTSSSRNATIRFKNARGCFQDITFVQAYGDVLTPVPNSEYIVRSHFWFEEKENDLGSNGNQCNVKALYSVQYGRKLTRSNETIVDDQNYKTIERVNVSSFYGSKLSLSTEQDGFTFGYDSSSSAISCTFEGGQGTTTYVLNGNFTDDGYFLNDGSFNGDEFILDSKYDDDDVSLTTIEPIRSNDDDAQFRVRCNKNAKYIELTGNWVTQEGVGVNTVNLSNITVAITDYTKKNPIALTNEYKLLLTLEKNGGGGESFITENIHSGKMNNPDGWGTISAYDYSNVTPQIFEYYDGEDVELIDNTDYDLVPNQVTLTGEWVDDNNIINPENIIVSAPIASDGGYQIELHLNKKGGGETIVKTKPFGISEVTGNGATLKSLFVEEDGGRLWPEGDFEAIDYAKPVCKGIPIETDAKFSDTTTFTVVAIYTIISNAYGCKVVIDEEYRDGFDVYEKEIGENGKVVFKFNESQGKEIPVSIKFHIDGFESKEEKSISYTDGVSSTSITYDESKTTYSITKQLNIIYKEEVLPNNGTGEVAANSTVTMNIQKAGTDYIEKIEPNPGGNELYDIQLTPFTSNSFPVKFKRKTDGDLTSQAYEEVFTITTHHGQTIQYRVEVEDKDSWSFANADYLVFTYNWNGKNDGTDLDTITRIESDLPSIKDTNIWSYEVSKRGVGYSNGTSVPSSTDIYEFLRFAGDNQGDGNEYTLVNFKDMKRYLKEFKITTNPIVFSVSTNWFVKRVSGNWVLSAKAINADSYSVNSTERSFDFVNEKIVKQTDSMTGNTFNRGHHGTYDAYQHSYLIKYDWETGIIKLDRDDTNQYYTHIEYDYELYDVTTNKKLASRSVNTDWDGLNESGGKVTNVEPGKQYKIVLKNIVKEIVYPDGQRLSKTIDTNDLKVSSACYYGGVLNSVSYSNVQKVENAFEIFVMIDTNLGEQIEGKEQHPEVDIIVDLEDASKLRFEFIK